jgi:hypothetical protein
MVYVGDHALGRLPGVHLSFAGRQNSHRVDLDSSISELEERQTCSSPVLALCLSKAELKPENFRFSVRVIQVSVTELGLEARPAFPRWVLSEAAC